MHFRFEHEFDIDPKGFWEFFFTDEYNRDLYAALKMKEWKVVEQEDDGTTLRRSLRVTPSSSMPSVLQKVISDQTYTERDVFHRAKSSMDVVIEPAMLKNKFDMRAVYKVEPVGPEGSGRCRRSFEGDVKVSIMLIGGKIEQFTIDQMRTSYEISSVVTRRWAAKKKPA
ncbi:MAG: DUF2505 domain-containing protein [Myxococcales bacterium]|nr:DUF2505 domain-containing protein [Myxococcales bacterium]